LVKEFREEIAMAKIFDKMLDFLGVENTENYDEYEEEYQDMPQEKESIRTVRKRTESRDEAPEVQHIEREQRKQRKPNLVGVSGGQSRQNMVLYQPQSNDDTQNIIDYMKAHRSVIINLEQLDSEVAQRILDFVSGASYALNGKIHKISSEIFLLAPSEANVMNNLPGNNKDNR
jgi:cell division inhibitor SepF